MERKLASIQQIQDVSPIPGADAIEKVSILGWNCVAKKGEFHAGDLCVYFEIDSFLPEREEFEFLRKSSFKRMGDERGFRLKTIRLRGQISQGLAMPVSTFFSDTSTLNVGDDVTETLGVKKWDPPVPAKLRGKVKGNFPGFLRKTDEIRVQSAPRVIQELQGNPYYITTKLDGTSATFYYKDAFGVCSRNMELKEVEGNTYWDVARYFDLEERLKSYGSPVCIQGEMCGPGIQKNPLGLKEPELFVFNVFDIKTGEYFYYESFVKFCSDLGLQTVPVEEDGESFQYSSVDELLKRAEGKYESGSRKEGIVIRAKNNMHSDALKSRLSFKVINNEYLLKNES